MDQQDFDPREPEQEPDDRQSQEPEETRFPYEDYYDPDFRGTEPPRKHNDSKEPRQHDHNLLPIAIFAGLLVVGCLVIVSISGIGDGFFSVSNGMQLQTEKESTASASPQPSAEAVEEVEAPVAAAEPTPDANLGSGTVLKIEQTPEGTDTAIESSRPEGALSLQEIYAKVIPSVVSITSTLSDSVATGTGIIMSEDGYVITNYHVIEDATKLEVLLQDDTSYTAVLVGGDETSDLAVLKIDASGLTAASFGSSSDLQVGDEVVAIGDPLGTELRGTMTNGIISAINRDLTVNDRTMTLIQTNAALNSGNSGGPLINCYGQVIGINTMKMSSYYSSVEGLGFAIPISTAKPIIDELIEKGYVSGRPAIGIRLGQELNNAIRAYYNIPEGVLVQSVTASSDAAAQGLQAGDVIIAFEGTTVTSSDELRSLLNQYTAGESVRLTVWRNGDTFDLSIVLMDAHDNNQ